MLDEMSKEINHSIGYIPILDTLGNLRADIKVMVIFQLHIPPMGLWRGVAGNITFLSRVLV